ncbi:MAG TPA: hypothetical protein VEA37_14160 [Flavobacterium sp.]|nr:hypothetical protein [Flavobacterium sp.]
MSTNENTIWKIFAALINGNYVEHYYWHSDKAEVEYRGLRITFDNYTAYASAGSTTMQQTYTRVIVPHSAATGFTFELARKNVFSTITTFFGAQDVEVGDAEFDKAFVIKANDPASVKKLYSSWEVRKAITEQPKINLLISDRKGIWEENLPEGLRELSLLKGKLRI